MTTPNINMEELAKLIQSNLIKKPRKKKERTAEQETAMKEKLSMMRKKLLDNRVAKALVKIDGTTSQSLVKTDSETTYRHPNIEVKSHDELFEKKYNNKFEKLDESIGEIKNSISEIKELKKNKAQRKANEEIERNKLKTETAVVVPAVVVPAVKSNIFTVPVAPVVAITSLGTIGQMELRSVPNFKKMFKK